MLSVQVVSMRASNGYGICEKVKSAKTAFEENAAKYPTGLTGIATGNVKVFLFCFFVFVLSKKL